MLVHSAIVCAVKSLRIHLKQYGVHSQSDQKKHTLRIDTLRNKRNPLLSELYYYKVAYQ